VLVGSGGGIDVAVVGGGGEDVKVGRRDARRSDLFSSTMS
jgi:hypothetical protein